MKIKFLFIVSVLFFLSGAVFGQPVSADTLLPIKGYLLGPGDELSVKVLGEQQFDFLATVDEDGKIGVPFVDKRVVAKCRTESDLGGEVTTLLGKYLRNPQLSLNVTKRNSRSPSSIYGEVVEPQHLVLMRKVSLMEMIAFAGGLKEEAGGTVQVFRTQAPMCSDTANPDRWQAVTADSTDVPMRVFSLASVRTGRDEANPTIYPGDVVVVQRALPIFVVGEVVYPQGIFIKDGGLTLTEAIAKLGGVRREAKTKDIRIYRLKENSKEREMISANYDLIKKGQQKDILLQPQDIVEVDKAKESIAQTVMKFALGMGRTIASSAATGGGYRVIQ